LYLSSAPFTPGAFLHGHGDDPFVSLPDRHCTLTPGRSKRSWAPPRRPSHDTTTLLTIAFLFVDPQPRKCGFGCSAPSPIRWSASGATIDDEISSPQSRTGRWAAMVFCLPALWWRVRKLYLPAGARYFRSRQPYYLAYETRASRDEPASGAWRLRAQMPPAPLASTRCLSATLP